MATAKAVEVENQQEEMEIAATFKFMEARPFDPKYRVNLGKSLAGILKGFGKFSSFNIYLDDAGRVLLVPMSHIPLNEMWTWTDKETRKSFEEANKDFAKGDVAEVDDLDQFLDSL
jgi:hypothetical protein